MALRQSIRSTRFARACRSAATRSFRPGARALAGEAAVLTAAPIVACEETGGSTAGPKLIPYTAASFLAFRAAVLPWLGDLAKARPQAFSGRAYAAISPVARSARETSGGIPVGVSDGAYLGPELAPAFAANLAVPPSVGDIDDIDEWRAATLSHLVAARDLTFISVWSPTFLIGLIEALPKPLDTQSLWPHLDTISAWADGPSRLYAQRLHELFPHAYLQPKGLLATEGAVTIPWNGARVPAIASGFLEFIDESGAPRLCDELRTGDLYRVVMTTPGGLYRYDLGDRVRCARIRDGLPDLAFAGRAGIFGDLVGEKLSEDFLATALRDAGVAACLAPHATATPHYELLADAPPVAPRTVPGLIDRYLRAQSGRGRRLGDIKPPLLIHDPDKPPPNLPPPRDRQTP